MKSKEFYTVPFVWDKRIWAVTFAVFILWICVSIFLFYNIFTQENSTEPLIALLLFNAIMLPTILACEGYAPLGALSLSMLFHGVYNLLVSKSGVTSWIGYVLPLLTALMLFLALRRLRSEE